MDPAKAAQIVEVLNGLTARDQVKRLQKSCSARHIGL
jgi:hypothetical protein